MDLDWDDWLKESQQPAQTQRWLVDTAMLQLEHPRIRIQASKLTQLKHGAREKAVACFDYVRALPLKFSVDSHRAQANVVLGQGFGDAYSKTTLLVALLRCSGVPCRMRFLVMRPEVVRGLWRPVSATVAQPVTEIWIEGRWLVVDAYVVDVRLALACRTQLLAEGRRMGYGLHMLGQGVWNATDHVFGCFAAADAMSWPLEQLGSYDDAAAFHAAHREWAPCNSTAMRCKRLVSATLANRRVAALRSLIEARRNDSGRARCQSPINAR